MSFKIDSPIRIFVPEKPAPAIETAPPLLPKTPDNSFVAKRYETQFAGNNLRLKLEKQVEDKINPREIPVKPDSLTGKELKDQQNEQIARRLELETKKALNEQIINSKDASFWDKIKAKFENGQIQTDLDRLATESKITNENLAAIQRGDQRAIAFFDAMNRTNATGDPWDMNPGDAFRESLDPAAQKVYDETLANLRNDPRVQFDFAPGTVDSLAFREIALRGMVAATFGRPQDLEARIQQAVDNSDNHKYTISYVPEDTSTKWGALGGRDGITAKQPFVVQQIANINDNLFIHEFSHTLQSDADGSIDDLPNEFDFVNSVRFQLAFNTPEFQKYIGQTKIDGETFPGIQNRFRQDPQGLKDVSPEMYQLMVDYSGFDPLTGSLR